MRNFLLAVLIIITVLLSTKAAFASCPVKPSAEDSAKSSSVVFVGTVKKITPAQIANATYSIMAKKPKWERYDEKVDVVTFVVSEAFKGVSSETIDITTGTDGFAGYKFEGGTWLKEGQTYLVYADKRLPVSAAPDRQEDDYDKESRAELLNMYKAFPKKLAVEIEKFNSKISPYESNICMRTTHISNATEELEKLRKMFPKAKKFNGATNEISVNQPASLWQRLISFLGLV